MKYTIPEASQNLSWLLKKAYFGQDVIFVVDEDIQLKLVPVRGEFPGDGKDRVPSVLKGEIVCTPNAFDSLTDQELSDLGFE